MADRTPRSMDLRENQERIKAWAPPSILPDPTPQEGYTFRWIRIGYAGQSDKINASAQFRQGYEPVRAEDHPELQIRPDKGEYENNVVIGDLILCKAPTEIIKQRQAHYQRLTDSQIEGVDNSLFSQNDPRAPLLRAERASSVMRHR